MTDSSHHRSVSYGASYNPAFAASYNPALTVGTAPPYVHTPLGSLVSSCVFDLDATVADSYDGTSQTWVNIETTPADSAAQAEHDFYLGPTSSVTSADPTFNGSSGSPSAYFSVDGGDYFRNVAASAGAQPAFYRDLHKSTGGQAHSFVFAVRYPDTGGTSRQFAGCAGHSGAQQGMNYYSPGSTQANRAGIGWHDGSGSSTNIASPIISDDTDKIVVFTFDPSTRTYKIYVNQTSSPTTALLGAQVSTTDCSYIFEIMAGGNAILPAASGSRIYAASGYNAVLSDADVALIVAEYEARHSRTYV